MRRSAGSALWLLPLSPALPGCGLVDLPSACDDLPGGGAGENILIIVTDDIGIDKTAVYGEHPAPARTPHIDALAAEGVLFRNAYASPTCSPTRASLLTGRHPSHTGIGQWIYPLHEADQLPQAELTIAEVLAWGPYDHASAAVGKWHLTGFDAPDPPRDPMNQGFACHAGSLGNPLDAYGSLSTPRGYTHWEKSVDGVTGRSNTWMCTDTTDEALDRIADMREPWLLYVAYNGAHEPAELPPHGLYTPSESGTYTERETCDAMIEATDRELGRLLEGIPPEVRARTTIIYLSDNGTHGYAIAEPWDPARGKGTMFEGGIGIPLIVAGPHVGRAGSESAALVHVVDVLPTVAELAGVDLPAVTDAAGQPLHVDGVSLLPWIAQPELPSPRDAVYAEAFHPNHATNPTWREQAVREAEWKLIRRTEGGAVTDGLYRLPPGAWDDGEDLVATAATDPEAGAALARLRNRLAAIDADLGR